MVSRLCCPFFHIGMWHFSELLRNLFLFFCCCLTVYTDAFHCAFNGVDKKRDQTQALAATNRGLHSLCVRTNIMKAEAYYYLWCFRRCRVSQQLGGKTLMPPRMRNEHTNSQSGAVWALCSHPPLCVSKSEWVERVRFFAPDRYTHTPGSAFSDWAHAALHLASLARFSKQPTCKTLLLSLSPVCGDGAGIGRSLAPCRVALSAKSRHALNFWCVARQLNRWKLLCQSWN